MIIIWTSWGWISCIRLNTLSSRRHFRHFADDILKYSSLFRNVWISLKISLRVIPKVRFSNIAALVLTMACRRPSDNQLFELMMVSLLTHVCAPWPQWVDITLLNWYRRFHIYLWMTTRSLLLFEGYPIIISSSAVWLWWMRKVLNVVRKQIGK